MELGFIRDRQRAGIDAAKLRVIYKGGPVTFDIDSAVKDLRTMLAEGKARGVELPLVEQTLACYEETKRKVSGAAEVSAVSVYWANRSKS